ncbi:WD40 repeat-like protein [Leucogyrophana mollusca]|uniref:WD40 repeat-like protein n=1 Tax=Leucogyrophana mollusca TaxID=85980 RepID=A0ACB8AUZ8_9AGAM|nr:WD40 repeat-like protein [Leucogyrophana mollusca]
MSTSSYSFESPGVLGASYRLTKVFKGHTRSVSCVAYFPDGRRLASASGDKTVIIWDVESGRQDGQPLQHDSSVWWIAISLNGRRIASGTEEDGVVVWDVLTREMVHEIKGDVYELAYSPDGRWIATAPMDAVEEVQLWDADTGRPGREPLICAGEVFRGAFSPDGSQIAVGFENGHFQVIDIATGESVLGPIKGHAECVSSIVYSPDGRLLITGSWDESIRVWNSETGVAVGKPMRGHEQYGVGCISISADGRKIASRDCDGTVRVWDLETQLQVGVPFDARDQCAAISPNGRYVVGGNLGSVYLWDTESLAIQGPSSPPTASAQNAPLSAVQEFHQAISRFCNTLSKPRISVSLVEAPKDWLRANNLQILQVPSIQGKQRAEVELIFPVNQPFS